MVTLVPSDHVDAAARAAQLAADVIHDGRDCIPHHTPVRIFNEYLGGWRFRSILLGGYAVCAHQYRVLSKAGRDSWTEGWECAPFDVGDTHSSCERSFGGT